MDNDILGKKGQKHFEAICLNANLICNSSVGNDRLGWDYVVEFQFEKEVHGNNFDTRQKPTSCYVQVKTIGRNVNVFKMRLSSAEYFSKQEKPSFIYIIRSDGSNGFIESYLIHLLDTSFAKILKRLRQERANHIEDLNHKYITFHKKDFGQPIGTDGSSLKSCLQAACGKDMFAYVAEKKKQFDQLGFPRRPFKVNTILKITEDEMIDAMLGLKKEVEAEHIETFETRFDISIPISPSGSGILRIEPNAADKCKIKFSLDAFSRPAIFDAKIFYPALPGLPREKLKVLFKSDDFTLIMKHDDLSLEGVGELKEQRTTKNWQNLFRYFLVLAKGGSVEVLPEKLPSAIYQILPMEKLPFTEKTCKAFLSVFEKLEYLLQVVGSDQEIKVELAKVNENGNNIFGIWTMFTENKVPSLTFETNITDEFNKKLKAGTAYIGQIDLGQSNLVYSASTILAFENIGDKIKWHSEQMVPHKLACVKNQEEFDKFVNHVKNELNTTTMITFRADINETQLMYN